MPNIWYVFRIKYPHNIDQCKSSLYYSIMSNQTVYLGYILVLRSAPVNFRAKLRGVFSRFFPHQCSAGFSVFLWSADIKLDDRLVRITYKKSFWQHQLFQTMAKIITFSILWHNDWVDVVILQAMGYTVGRLLSFHTVALCFTLCSLDLITCIHQSTPHTAAMISNGRYNL